MFKNICWVNGLFTAMIIFLFFVSISAGLSSCGNKGDLYLPDNTPSTTPSTTPSEKKG